MATRPRNGSKKKRTTPLEVKKTRRPRVRHRPPTAQGRLSRGEVAQRLKTHKSHVRYLERTGRLHPIVDHRGWYWFDPLEVDAIAEQRKELRKGRGAGPRVSAPSASRVVRVELTEKSLHALANLFAEALRAALESPLVRKRARSKKGAASKGRRAR